MSRRLTGKRSHALFVSCRYLCERLRERTKPWPQVHVYWLTGPHRGDKQWIPKANFSSGFTKIHPERDPQKWKQLTERG